MSNNGEGDEPPLIRANDIFSITFGDDKTTKYPPSFTHQIFDNEQICCSSSDNVKIHVHVNHDMSTTLDIYNACDEDKSYIRQKLAKLTPTPPDPLTRGRVGSQIKEVALQNNIYFLHLATHKDDGALSLLQRAEKIAVFYIETADSVDFADERWEVLWIYTQKAEHMTLVGYLTLFTFHNPFAGRAFG